MSIRDFLCTFGLHINFFSQDLPSLQCANDEFIMDALRTLGHCTPTELQHLNACRMFRQVARLSDISSADGTSIRRDVLQGLGPSIYLLATKWPRQGHPLPP